MSKRGENLIYYQIRILFVDEPNADYLKISSECILIN